MIKVLRIQGKYLLDRRLGGGSYGDVYEVGHDLKSGREVALKIEHQRVDPSSLENEIEIYKTLSGGTGIPQFYWHGYEGDFRVMAFELLGPNLENLLQYCNGKFSLKTVLMLADQLIPRCQYLHSKGFVHRDIKPENLLIGDGKQGNIVYVTDIGLAKEVGEPGLYQYSLIGTMRFASVNAHLGVEQSPRDDMESLGYVLVYLLQGRLPWQGLKVDSSKQKEQCILQRKQSPAEHDLYADAPEEFKRYFDHVRSLKFEERPNYSYLRRLFQSLFRRQAFEYDHVFDWTVLKYLESVSRLGGPGVG
ncbi:kinase-like protein [Viridothelium virens]|uniref:non-specific serine/threonine protein kinase n=1 Tax=Viridothelium virens TaxID=1048519 RepID=A0A6A6GT36_VIRVR|nr:kinase-like protein [Viridothelium virens]